MKNDAFTKEEKSWIMYDVANSAFTLIIVTSIMPIFFKDVASRGIDSAVATSNWGFALSFSSLLIALAAPVLGSIADYPGMKKKLLAFFLVIGVVSTLAMWSVTEGAWILCIGLFVIAKIGFQGSLIFYDSLIVDVTTEERMDRVSSHGFGWGYIGSVIPFLASIGILLYFQGKAPESGGAITLEAARIIFVLTAAWWLVFSVPILRDTKQKYATDKKPGSWLEPVKNVLVTLGNIRNNKEAFIFLVAYFFYIDGVDTIIGMSAVYGKDVGLSTTVLILAILMIQVVAWPFAILFGRLAKIIRTKTMITVAIGIYSVITLFAFTLPFLPSMDMKVAVFWILAFLVATSQGGIQALSRSYFGKLVPKEQSAEFFGFYNVIGKFATILGPLLMGVVSLMTGNPSFGILSILILFIVGAILLQRVKEQPVSERS